MTMPIPDSVDTFLEHTLLQNCFAKPYHTWTDDERETYWRYQKQQNAYHQTVMQCVKDAQAEQSPTTQTRRQSMFRQYCVTLLQKIGVRR